MNITGPASGATTLSGLTGLDFEIMSAGMSVGGFLPPGNDDVLAAIDAYRVNRQHFEVTLTAVLRLGYRVENADFNNPHQGGNIVDPNTGVVAGNIFAPGFDPASLKPAQRGIIEPSPDDQIVQNAIAPPGAPLAPQNRAATPLQPSTAVAPTAQGQGVSATPAPETYAPIMVRGVVPEVLRAALPIPAPVSGQPVAVAAAVREVQAEIVPQGAAAVAAGPSAPMSDGMKYGLIGLGLLVVLFVVSQLGGND